MRELRCRGRLELKQPVLCGPEPIFYHCVYMAVLSFQQQRATGELCLFEERDVEEGALRQESEDQSSSPTSAKSPHDLAQAPYPFFSKFKFMG